MTANVFSTDLFTKLLASIPAHFNILVVREGEPNALQLLKLAIRAFFNNILRCEFIESHGNDYIKALWLIENIQCATQIYRQYNYMEYYPFVNDNVTDYIPPFMTNTKSNNDIVHIWQLVLEKTPYVMAANTTLKRAIRLQRDDILDRLRFIADEEQKTITNIKDLAIKLMFDIGEYNSTIDKLIDIFIPINRDDENEFYEKMKSKRDRDYTKANEPPFNDRTVCVLKRDNNGSRILTMMRILDK